MTRIAAIIVTYNRRDKLLQCIDAVMAQIAEVQPDIIVVDNNSSDGTSQAVRDYIINIQKNRSYRSADEETVNYLRQAGTGGQSDGGNRTIVANPNDKGRIIYYNLGYNSGGAGGFTWGIRKVVESGYDYLWLMDDDCIPDEHALEEYLKFASILSNDWGYLSGKTLWTDGSICEMNVQRETVFRDVSPEKLSNNHDPFEIKMASFVSLFLPARVVRDVGLPFRKFFLWTDDWEYTRRISRKYSCWYVPGSIAVHCCESNTGAGIYEASPERIDRYRYLYRNDVYLYRREGIPGAAYEAARLAAHVARIIAGRDSAREKISKIRIMLRGTADGLRFYPEPERVNAEPGDHEVISENT